MSDEIPDDVVPEVRPAAPGTAVTERPVTGSEKETLHRYLKKHRAALLAKVDGLAERQARWPLTPTGTNLLGLVKHVAGVQAGYLGEVFGLPETHHYHFDGVQPGLPERDYRFHLAKVDHAAEEVLGRIGRLWSKNPNAGELPVGR